MMLTLFLLITTLANGQDRTVTYNTLTHGSFPAGEESVNTMVYDNLSYGDVIPTPPTVKIDNNEYAFNEWSLVGGTPVDGKVGADDLIYEAIYSAATDITLSLYEYNSDYSKLSGEDFIIIPAVSVSSGGGAGIGTLVLTLNEADIDLVSGSKIDRFSCSTLTGDLTQSIDGNVLTISNVDLTAGKFFSPVITLSMNNSHTENGTPPGYSIDVELEVFDGGGNSLGIKTVELINEVMSLNLRSYIKVDGAWTTASTAINMGTEDEDNAGYLPSDSEATIEVGFNYYTSIGGNGLTPIYNSYLEVELPKDALFNTDLNDEKWSYVSGGIDNGDGTYTSEEDNPVIVKFDFIDGADGTLHYGGYSTSRTFDYPLVLTFPGAQMNTDDPDGEIDYVFNTTLKGSYQNDGLEVTDLVEDDISFQIKESGA